MASSMVYIPIAIVLAVSIIAIVEYPSTYIFAADNISSVSTDGPKRMISHEELALHDGNQTEVIWLSILSKVYDVSKGKEYYGEGGPYSIFVGRDANVPFITGSFTPEEGEKPVTELTAQQMYSLITWVDFYEEEEKYPFVGYLVGELYNADGTHTATMDKVQELADEGKAISEANRKKTRDIIAKRKRDDAEKKRKKDAAKSAQDKVTSTKPKAKPKDPPPLGKVVDGVMRLEPDEEL